MKKLTSRERVKKALNFEETDRVPIDLGAHTSSGISAIAYNNLKKHLGIKKSNTRIYDVIQELARPEELIMNKFNLDVLDVGIIYDDIIDWYDIELSDGSKAQYPDWFRPEKKGDDWFYYDEDGELIAKKVKGATYFDQTYFPYLDGYPDNFDDLAQDMKKAMWYSIPVSPFHRQEDDFWDDLRQKCIELRDNTDYALMLSGPGSLRELGSYLRRMDKFLMDLALDPKNVKKLMEAAMKIYMEQFKKICNAVGDVVDIYRFPDDLGTSSGMLLSPDNYREFFKPHQKTMIDYIHQNSDMSVLLHSCGTITPIIPDLIEIGLDIINPVQTNARDMEADKLKKEFGKDIVFWGGGANTQGVLNNGTPEEVKNNVKENLEIFAPGGGFVFNQIHNVLPDVPPENVIAMFEAVEEYTY
jgi:uroporphyrinogen decarboxylase